jgi:hypothetical protein
MAVNKVDLYVSQILEDLDNGLTWMKRDDVGYGSIQDKYNAKDQQITMIRKHPALKNAETNITVFNIIDDTKDGSSTISAPVSDIEQRHEATVERVLRSEPVKSSRAEQVLPVSNFPVEENLSGHSGTGFSDADSASAFANL